MQEAIISSMTRSERKNYKIIGSSRKQRIAKGSGTTIQDVNKLIKKFIEMSNVVKKLKGFNGKDVKGLKGLLNGRM